jgi:hypothetical protein
VVSPAGYIQSDDPDLEVTMNTRLRRLMQFILALTLAASATSATLIVVEAEFSIRDLKTLENESLNRGIDWLNTAIPSEVDQRYGPTSVALSEATGQRIEGDMQLVNRAYWGSRPASGSAGAWPSCPTPMSLMLHSSYGAARMEQLAETILQHGWQTITYRQAADMMRSGECPPPWSVMVSLDDLGTSWLRPEFREMIQVFLDQGLTLVLGVVVGGQQDPQVWEYLRALDAQGVEIASHTISHFNLPELEDEALDYEIQGSYQVICKWLEHCPITLILPFGNGMWDERIPEAAGDYLFVAGIPGGTEISGGAPFYLGRIGPDNDDAEHTLTLLYNTFLN